ncbi:MAG: segregation and condensation protein A [Eggerthellaceae bacterium]|jgi:segregation and condensation protein A
MSYRVRTGNFEGPFDLLLYLVSREKVDIGAISITQIADQYLDEISHMETLDLEVASDFLLVASTLLEIKAQSLIPKDEDETDEDIAELTPSEARDLLVERLITYKTYKNAAKELYARYESEARMHARSAGPGEDFMHLMPDFLRDLSLESLALIGAGEYARPDIMLLNSEHIAAKPIPVEVHVRAIHRLISNKKKLHFSDLVNEHTPTPMVVVTFLAVLELYKRSMVHLRQNEQFGDIDISYIEGSGELKLNNEDKLTSVEEN